MTIEYAEGDKVMFQGKIYDFGYYTAERDGCCVLYEEGERNMQDSIAVKLGGVSLVSRAAQPAPETGEWSLSSEVVNGMVKQGRISGPLTCIDIPKHYGAIAVFAGPEIAAQIINDHNLISQLIKALTTAQQIVFACNQAGTWDRELGQINDALALTTLRRSG